MTTLRSVLRGLAGLAVSSLVWIVLGLVYFIVTAWIVSFGVETVTGTGASADFVALSAALLAVGSLAGTSYSVGNMGNQPPQEDRYGASEIA